MLFRRQIKWRLRLLSRIYYQVARYKSDESDSTHTIRNHNQAPFPKKPSPINVTLRTLKDNKTDNKTDKTDKSTYTHTRSTKKPSPFPHKKKSAV